MWGGRDEHVSMADALAVPPHVRAALAEACPVEHFSLYVAGDSVAALTNTDDHPYELFVNSANCDGASHLAAVASLTSTRHRAHADLARDSRVDPRLPVCRDVWDPVTCTSVALDVVVPPLSEAPRFPFRATVLLLSAEHVAAGRFTPLAVQPNTEITFLGKRGS
jgi:hypothetical protein